MIDLKKLSNNTADCINIFKLIIDSEKIPKEVKITLFDVAVHLSSRLHDEMAVIKLSGNFWSHYDYDNFPAKNQCEVRKILNKYEES